jgi:hypothetical protein
MDVYKRPMFVQGGGPPAPVNAPVNASPNVGTGAGIPQELQMAMVNAEQEGAAIGQGIGRNFVASMFEGLDNAEDYEQAINALRGNELPLSARYDELGEIVGDEDAKDTPESVLALVQPAIMMTEEGAMNSGVGGLMEGLTGDVPVEGPMEEGIGSLMMAGQPDEPPMPPGPDPTALGPTLNGTPQGFAAGGAVTRFRNSPVVQNFAEAGEVKSLADYASYSPEALTGTVKDLYEERLPLYEAVSARDPAADRAAFWAQMAQFGLNLASPPPELRGRSPAEALAAAAKVPFANIAQIGARAGEGKRAARIGALQAAERAQTAQQAALYKRGEQKATQAFRSTVLRAQMSFDQKEGETARNWKERLAGDDRQLQRDLRATMELGLDQRQQAQAEINEKLEKNRQQYKLAQIAAEHENAQEILGLQTNAAMERLIQSQQITTFQQQQQKLAQARLEFDKKRNSDDLALRNRAQTSLEEFRDKKWVTDAENEAFLRDHRRAMLELDERKAQARVNEHAALMKLRGAAQQDLNNFNNAMMQHRADVLGVDKEYKEALARAKNAAAGLNAFGKGLEGRILGMFSNKPVLDAYADGSLDRSNPNKVLELNNAITYWQQRKFGQRPDGKSGWLPGNTLTGDVLKAVRRREDMIKNRTAKSGTTDLLPPPIIGREGADGNIVDEGETGAVIRGTVSDVGMPPPPRPIVVETGRETEAVRATDADVGIGLPTLTMELSQEQRDTAKEILQNIEAARKNIAGADIEAGTGLPKAIAMAGSYLASTFRDFNMFGKGIGWSDFSKAPEVSALINRLQLSVKMAVKEFGSRTAWAELEDIEKRLMPPPSVFTTDDEAAAGHLETSKWLAQQVAKAQAIVDNPEEYIKNDPKALSKARQALPMYSALQGSFIALHEALKDGGAGVSSPDKEDKIRRAMDRGRNPDAMNSRSNQGLGGL